MNANARLAVCSARWGSESPGIAAPNGFDSESVSWPIRMCIFSTATFMTAAMAAFAVNDAMMKYLAATLPVSEIMVLRGLVATGRGIARPGMSVKITRDLPIGHVTSGTFSPTLRKGVALALVNSQVQLGAEVLVDVRGRGEVFVVTKPPFVQPGVRA